MENISSGGSAWVENARKFSHENECTVLVIFQSENELSQFMFRSNIGKNIIAHALYREISHFVKKKKSIPVMSIIYDACGNMLSAIA